MLNISFGSVRGKVDESKYKSFGILGKKDTSRILLKVLGAIFLLGFLSLFLPWTQNIRAKGYVTTLNPDDRPQTIQSLIGGRIEKWYVQEGQKVEKGDTIIMISEVKEEYLDPEILARTSSQIEAKNQSAFAYDEKAKSLNDQIVALKNNQSVKLEQNQIKINQTQLKIQSDSMDLVAARVKLDIAQSQLNRLEELYSDGLKSLTDLEAKRLSLQESNAKVIALVNKIDAQRNELLNLQANKQAIKNEFQDKIAKATSDRMSALSSKFNAEANVNKLQSQYNAYEVRQQNYYIKSPISGIITKAIKYGIGEIIKNGEEIISIMPNDYQLAIEMYVDPMDMPLLNKNQKVRVQFDGWPAIVFSGWPNNSFGTFGGEVFAIDNFISDNGKYRLLVSPDPEDNPWPKQIRIGGGANTITLLNEVTVGYELWRQLNGFPPDYYKNGKSTNLKTKAPLKKLK